MGPTRKYILETAANDVQEAVARGSATEIAYTALRALASLASNEGDNELENSFITLADGLG